MNAISLLLRADGSDRLGTGHVMRSIALAQACRAAGGSATFAIAEASEALLDRVRHAGFDVNRVSGQPGSSGDALQTIKLAAEVGATWVSIDGYVFVDEYQRLINQAGLRQLVVDDYGHADRYSADVILNQNLSAQEEMYANRPPSAHLLLGPRYALLRSEFSGFIGWHRPDRSPARHILVTLGGSDPDNVTAKVLVALDRVAADIDVTTVVGGSYRHDLPIETAVRDAENMPELMESADIAIVAGGSTAWELAFMGLPSVTLVVAENQVELAASLGKAGVTRNLGPQASIDADSIAAAVAGLLADPALRREMSWRGQQLVDGRGAERVIGLAATLGAA